MTTSGVLPQDHKVESDNARALTLYLTIVLLLSAVWVNSERLSVQGWALTIVALALAVSTPLSWPASSRGTGKPAVGSALGGLALAAPTAAYLTLTWRQEFPFLGDHNVHLRYLEESFDFWKIWLLPVTAAMILAAYLYRRRATRWIALLTVAAMGIGLVVDSPARFAVRYPGLFHFIAFPANAASQVFSWDSPLNAARLTNAATPLVWLFILRPLIIGRWPDRHIAPLAAFLLFQKDFIYYFTSAYLEPYAVVLVLTAMELLFVEGRDGALRSALLIGIASMIKEPAFLVLPFFGVMAFTSQDRRRAIARKGGALLVAATPFLLYYDVRKHSAVFRKAAFESLFSEAATSERFIRFGQRLGEQFGWATVVMLALALTSVTLSLLPNRHRLFFAATTSASILSMSFFFLEKASAGWIAYPRFQLIPLALLSAPLLVVGEMLSARADAEPGEIRVALPTMAIAVLLIAFHLPSTALFFGKSAGNDVDRNFFEHKDAPIYFPVAALTRAASDRGMLDRITTIGVVSNIHGVVAGYGLFSLPLAYPRISRTYRIGVGPLDSRSTRDCGCTSKSEAKAGFFVYFPPGDWRGFPRAAMQRAAQECEAEMVRSCSSTVSMRREGQLIASIGSGVRITPGPSNHGSVR